MFKALIFFLAVLLVVARSSSLTSLRFPRFGWKRKQDLPTPLSDFSIVTARRHNHQVAYISGGCTIFLPGTDPVFFHCNTSNELWEFHSRKNQYTVLPPFVNRRYRHQSAVLAKPNKIVVFGGRTQEDDISPTIEVFDLATSTCKYVLP